MKLVICFLLVCAATISHGQQPAPAPTPAPTPSAAFDPLAGLLFMKGNWSGKQNFNNPGGGSMAGEATDKIDIGIGGRYLCETLSTTMPGRKPTDSRHFISFDKQSGKYGAWWFNDTGTHPTEFTGELSENKLVLTSISAGPGPVLRATYETPAKNTLTYLLEMKQGESWIKLFLTAYTKSADSQ